MLPFAKGENPVGQIADLPGFSPDFTVTKKPTGVRRKRPTAGTFAGLGAAVSGYIKRPVVLVGLAAAGVAAVVLFAVVVTVRTPEGTLVVESDDPNVQVAVKQGSALVEVVDARSGWKLSLKSGQYELAPQGSANRFQLDRDSVTVRRGEVVTVKVTLKRDSENSNPKSQVSDSKPQIPSPPDISHPSVPPPAVAEVLAELKQFRDDNADYLKLHNRGADGGIKAELNTVISQLEAATVNGDLRADKKDEVKSKAQVVESHLDTLLANKDKTGSSNNIANRKLAEIFRKLDLSLGVASATKTPPAVAPPGKRPSEEPPNTALATGPARAVAPFNAPKAKEHQAAWAKHLGVPVVETNSIGMKLVLIPPGEFMMGSPTALIEEELQLHHGDPWYTRFLQAEVPQHRVRVNNPYRLAATDVTQEEYQRVMGSNPSKFQDPRKPVEHVSWDDAVEFCGRLSELAGEKAAKRRYALPTEAQWEYACRAGTTTRWYSGDEVAGLDQVAWFGKNAGGMTHAVGQKAPNAWGLYDMHGNVWQWCQDSFDKGYYTRRLPMIRVDLPEARIMCFAAVTNGLGRYTAGRRSAESTSGPPTVSSAFASR